MVRIRVLGGGAIGCYINKSMTDRKLTAYIIVPPPPPSPPTRLPVPPGTVSCSTLNLGSAPGPRRLARADTQRADHAGPWASQNNVTCRLRKRWDENTASSKQRDPITQLNTVHRAPVGPSRPFISRPQGFVPAGCSPDRICLPARFTNGGLVARAPPRPWGRKDGPPCAAGQMQARCRPDAGQMQARCMPGGHMPTMACP